MRIKELRHILSQIPLSDDGKELAVYMPYYQREFSVVAFDHLASIKNEPVTEDSPLVLITARAPL